MWRGPLPHVSVTVVVTSARPSCAPTTPRCRASAHSTSSLPRMRPARLQRTPAPRRAPPTRSTRSHTLPSRRCARFADHAARPADQIARGRGRRRARPVVHRHPRQPPHRGVDSRCVSARRIVCRQDLTAMSRDAPAVEPDAFRADQDAALHHQPGSRLPAEQPQQRMLHANIVIVRRRIDPAQLPCRWRSGPSPGPNCPPARTKVRRNDGRTPTTSLPSTPAALEIPQRAESEFDPATSDAEAPASSAASRPRSSPHADSHNDASPT
jgi:hypothetical protein